MGMAEKVAIDKQEPVRYQVENSTQGVNKREQDTRPGDRQKTARHQATRAKSNSRKTEGPSGLEDRRGKRPCC